MKASLWIPSITFAMALNSTTSTPMSYAQVTPATPPVVAEAPLRVSNSFHFVVNAPLSEAAPLFGPEGERSWAGKHWNPEFLYPRPSTDAAARKIPEPALDIQGAVFTIQHGPYKSVWVNTVFDLAAGRMQYVAFVPGLMVSIIDVRLTSTGPATTGVEVTYARTALDPSANDEVRAHGDNDRGSALEWQQAIEASLKERRQKAP